MTNNRSDKSVLTVESIDEIHIRIACQHFRISEEFVEALVVEGVFEPPSRAMESWLLTPFQYQQLRRAARLHRDLGVNPPGIALALELMAQLESANRF